MNLLDLSGKTILITGGAGAIGAVVVKTLAEHGARVAVNDVVPASQAQADLAASGLDADQAMYYQADATQPAPVAGVPKKVMKSGQGSFKWNRTRRGSTTSTSRSRSLYSLAEVPL